MRELLKRWAQLQPSRCNMRTETLGPALVTLGGYGHYYWGGPASDAVVLAATIEAIDSRKWAWSLQGPRKSQAEHTGIVYHPKQEDGPPWKVMRGASPAAALLRAYLAALEAEAQP